MAITEPPDNAASYTYTTPIRLGIRRANELTDDADTATPKRIPVAAMGTGTPNGSKFLRDDRTWQPGGLSSKQWEDITQTVWAVSPSAESGLTAVSTTGTVDSATALQAILNYVDTTYGAGRVVLPAGKIVKCNSGITVPDLVTLMMLPGGNLDFSGMSASGTAITVNWPVDGSYTRSGYVVLDGVCLSGPGGGAGATSVGVSVTGVSLRFIGLRIWNFGRGFDPSHSETWLVSLINSTIRNCQICYYLDNESSAASNAGEEMVIDRCVLFNAQTAIRSTGAGVHLQVTDTSIDYCGLFMYARESWNYFVGCHLESQGGTSGTYLIQPAGNAKIVMQATDVIMGAGTTSTLNFLFDPNSGPSNFGNGQAHFSTTKIYAINPSGGDVTHYSDQLIEFPANQTTMTIFTPFPTSWCMVEAKFVAQSFRTEYNDTLRVTGLSGIAGTVTLTAGSSYTDVRFARIRFS